MPLAEQTLPLTEAHRRGRVSPNLENRDAASTKQAESSIGTSNRMGRKRWMTWVMIAVAVASVGFGATRFASDSRGEAPPSRSRALPVETLTAEPVTSYRQIRHYTGEVVARRATHLGFEVAAKLQAVFADEGDRVVAGETLAKLDMQHLEMKRRELQARRAEAAAKLEEMITGPRTEVIEAARARVESLSAQVEFLRRQQARRERLLKSNATSQEDYDEIAFGLTSRKAELQRASHQLEELLNGTRKEQIQAQRAVVEQLDSAIADVEIDLEKSTLKASFSGTVARRLADEGTVLAVGQSVFRLIEDQALEAWVGLPPAAASRLSEDSIEQLLVGDTTYPARVSGRLPEIDPATRTRTVVLELDPATTGEVVHGQVVRLEQETEVATDGFWLPLGSLTRSGRGLWSLFAVIPADASENDDRKEFLVERRDVEMLHTESDRVLVRGAIRPGEKIVANGTHRLVPGQRVRPLR